MASFTDKPMQFNPYIQQLPVEEMVKVGMIKQDQYDKGVQKIQGQIDQVAGLDIYKDVDKAYLQSKLNQLGGNLTTVAAGDFSNFQLVNSVGGMVRQIGNDKIVQTAVGSTAWLRKQTQEMEAAIKAGKSSQANIYDFDEKRSKYASSTEVGETFSDRYTPYTDVKKKALEAIKILRPKLQQYDIPFEVINGQINTKKIADAMQRYKIEGIDEGQIKQAIFATLTPDDINQLSIDGRYQFRGVTSDQLAERATSQYKANRDEAIATIDFLNNKKKIITDPTELGKIDKQLEYYQLQVGSSGKPGELDEQLLVNLKNAIENPDDVKTSIYKDGFTKELANAFSWKNEEMQYVTNPLRTQLNWVEEQKFKIQQENRQRYEFSVTTGLRREEINISKQKLRLDAEANALKNAEIYGVDSPWTTLGNPTDNVLKANEMFVDHSESVANNIKSGRAQLIRAGYSDEQINMMLNKKIDIPAKAMGTIAEMLKQQSYLKSLEKKGNELRAAADKEAGVSEEKANAVKNKPSLNITWNGKNLQLSPEEILGIEAATTTITQASRGGNRRTTTINTQGFNKRQLDFVNSMKGVLYGQFEPGPQPKGYDAIRGQINSVANQYTAGLNKLRTAMNKSNEIYNQKLAPLITDFVPQIKALGADKDGSPTSATLGKVSALVTATIARGTYADENFSPSTSSEMISAAKSKDTRIFIEQSGDNYQVILKSESDPKKLQRIKVSKEDIIANFGPKYINENIQESTRLKLGNGNTNITGTIEGSLMQKAFGNFPGVAKMNITADLDQDLSNPNLYIPTINVMKKDGRWQSFPISGVDKLSRVGFDQGVTNLNRLTDDVLLKYLKTQYPSFDYSQLDIK